MAKFTISPLNANNKVKPNTVHYETIKEVPNEVIKYLYKENAPTEVFVEVIREVPVETIKYVDVPYEVIKEVPIYVDRPYEVIKEVPFYSEVLMEKIITQDVKYIPKWVWVTMLVEFAIILKLLM